MCEGKKDKDKVVQLRILIPTWKGHKAFDPLLSLNRQGDRSVLALILRHRTAPCLHLCVQAQDRDLEFTSTGVVNIGGIDIPANEAAKLDASSHDSQEQGPHATDPMQFPAGGVRGTDGDMEHVNRSVDGDGEGGSMECVSSRGGDGWDGGSMECVRDGYAHVSGGTELVGGRIDDVSMVVRSSMNPSSPSGVGSIWDAGVFESNQGSNVERW
eukprot:1140166-Pelagomonas_calceolata.AAC.4